MVTGLPGCTKPASEPATFTSASSGASVGTRVISCSPDCITEPGDTLATLSTTASWSARSSTSWRRSTAFFRFSCASLSLRLCSVSSWLTCARQFWL